MATRCRQNVNKEFFEKKFEILQAISDSIILVDNPAEIANLVLDIVVHHIDVKNCSLMLVNENEELYILAARGHAQHFSKSCRERIGSGIAGIVAKTRRPVFVKDIDKSKRFSHMKKRYYHTKSFISCPIVCKNKLLGVLNVNGKKNNKALTQEEFSLIKVISNQAAIAFENHFLVNQLKLKASELEEINQKLIEMDVMKSEFLMCMSHELRNPLNSIKGSVYYLNQSNSLDAAEQKEFYEVILNETDKLTSVIDNQLDFIETEEESNSVKNSVIDLVEILKLINDSRFLSVLLKKKHFQLLIDVQGHIPCVSGNKHGVVQLFYHLMDGVSYYLRDNDNLRIVIEDADLIQIRIIVPFTLPKAVIDDLFQSTRFSIKNDRNDRLKFYLARKIVEIHRWKMTAANMGNDFIISVDIPKSNQQMIDIAVNSSVNFFLEFIAELLGLNMCSIMLLNEFTGELTIRSAIGLHEDVLKRTKIRPGDRISGWVALEGQPLLIENIENDPRFGRISSPQYNTKSLLSIPLKIRGKVIGVLNLNNKKSEEPFTTRDLQLSTVLAERFSNLLAKLHAGDFLEYDLKHFISSLNNLLDAGKKYSKKQPQFPELVMQIMNKLEVSNEQKRLALYVSTIYDLGLTLLNDDILAKKRLHHIEKGAMRIHPYTTIELINNFEFSEEVNRAILHHHERFDGTGYPDGLQGEEIPIISRVVAVIDTFFAMITKNPYSDELTTEEALKLIKEGSGSLYDPIVVKAFVETLQENPMFLA